MSIPYSAELYGESFADVYDTWYDQVSDAEASADFVQQLCGSGTILELGIGSGRLAEPLLKRGVDVVGLDASMAMLKRCQLSDRLTLLLGDMRNLPFDPAKTRFDGVLIGFNTLFNLVTETDQRKLFCDIFDVLAPGGHLIVEATNHDSLTLQPDPQIRTQSFGITRQDADTTVVASTDVDYRAQQIDGCHIELSDTKVTLRPWKIRWSSTEQLDSYAHDAGLVLTTRSADWNGKTFTVNCPNHVSVYQHR